jgi:DNA-binding GntR family transcriptional regulator
MTKDGSAQPPHRRMEINRNGVTPPYKQIAADLRGQIERGELSLRMPSINDVQERYQVARNTARKALQLLKDEGFATIQPGWGTFVAKPGESAKEGSSGEA